MFIVPKSNAIPHFRPNLPTAPDNHESNFYLCGVFLFRGLLVNGVLGCASFMSGFLHLTERFQGSSCSNFTPVHRQITAHGVDRPRFYFPFRQMVDICVVSTLC